MGERHVSSKTRPSPQKHSLKSFYKCILDMATDLSMSGQSTQKSAIQVMRKYDSTSRGNNRVPSSASTFHATSFLYDAFEYSISIVVLHRRFLFFANPLLSQTFGIGNPDLCCALLIYRMFQRSFPSRRDVSQLYIDDSMWDRMEMGNVNDRYSHTLLSIISQ